MLGSPMRLARVRFIAIGLSLVLIMTIANTARGDTVVATVKVGPAPDSFAFDSSNGDIYVANELTPTQAHSVSVISGSTNAIVANVALSTSSPTGVTYDSINGDVYVAAENVSVISGETNTVVANVTIGPVHEGIVFDPSNGDVYVVTSKVAVISGLTNKVVENVTVGADPAQAVFDPANGDIYVTNTNPTATGQASGNGGVGDVEGSVSVISGSTNMVVATVLVGYDPEAVAFDAADGDIYVANHGFPTSLSVISGSTNTVVATVSIPPYPNGITYDPNNGDIYIAYYDSPLAGPPYFGNITVVSGLTNTVVATLDIGGGAIAFDPATGDIYMAGISYSIYVIAPSAASVDCAPLNFTVGSSSFCTASVTNTNSTTAGTSVGFSQTGGTGSVTLSSPTCALSAEGNCSVTVTGAEPGSVIVQASYPGDSNDAPASGVDPLTVSGTYTSASTTSSTVTSSTNSSTISVNTASPLLPVILLIVALAVGVALVLRRRRGVGVED